MLQSAPSHWSYVDHSFGHPSSYLNQPHYNHHHNPYAPNWPQQASAYTGSNGGQQAMYPPPMMPIQQQMPPPSLPPDHEPKQYPTSITESSPSTTSSTSIGSVVAEWGHIPPQQESMSELPHVCSFRGCGRAYKRKAELDRHTQEKHGPTSGRLLCPVKMCPRGILGEGFDRMSHLTQHLRSGKHKMTPSQAKYLAREHNPRKGGRNG